MNATQPRYELSLGARELLEIPDAARVQVTCARGSLWITLDNDRRDIVLETDETFFSTDHRRALVYAFEPSTLALQPEARAAVAPGPAHRFRFDWRGSLRMAPPAGSL
jgi:hypothetical protein